ncbi:MAG: UV DNA damage repair endonuclease UvsE [Caldilineaceae bacterium]
MTEDAKRATGMFPRYRLGFPVKVMGAALPSHDSRRWQNQPHLTVSLAYLRDIFTYLANCEIHFYRIAGNIAPYLTHPTLPQFHNQIEESRTELAATGDLARLYRIRLTMHPGHYIQLSSPDPARVARGHLELEACALLLEAMGLGTEAVVVIHIGGMYEDRIGSLERFVRNYHLLSPTARSRAVLENDDRIFDIQDILWVHRRTGIRLVLDVLHHRCLNRNGVPLIDALAQTLATWPHDEQPKIHYSSPRTELRYLYQNRERRLAMPLPNQHSDFINPFAFIDLLQNGRAAGLRPFDIMLEAKAKDLALLRLRTQVAQFAPHLMDLMA